MMKPFLRNHHYNLIRKQVNLLQQTINTVSDTKVVESVRLGVHARILGALNDTDPVQRSLADSAAELKTPEQFAHYLQTAELYLEAFPSLTGKQLDKLFPKVKKLKAPDPSGIDFRRVTYLGWHDIAMNRMFLVYHMDGRCIGIEGRYTASRKGVCFACNRHEDIVLFSAVQQKRPANAQPEYYKAIGNYLCADSAVCNNNITDVTAIERFVREVAGC